MAMRPFESTISFDEARRRLDAALVPVDRVEETPVAKCAGRVLARAVTSSVDVPPFDRSAMDGFAVRAADVAGATTDSPARLSCVGAVFTGGWPSRSIATGECMEIATGAPLPAGADAVVMVERTSREGHVVRVHAPVTSRQNVGLRASDIQERSLVLEAGAFLTPARTGALAAVGLATIPVFARPRVALYSTGNEVVQPGTQLRPGTIYDVNATALPPLVRANGSEVIEVGTLPDDVEAITEALRIDADVVLLTGGSSVGERDLVVDSVARRGGKLVFHGVNVKPGKPLLCARIGRTLVLGLPGNPASCLSNAYIFVVPALRRMARLPEARPERRRARLSRAVRSVADRHQFYTARLEGDVAHPAFKGSGDITSLSEADGYFEIPEGTAGVEAGTEIEVVLF